MSFAQTFFVFVQRRQKLCFCKRMHKNKKQCAQAHCFSIVTMGVGGNSKAPPSRAEPASRSAKKWMFTKNKTPKRLFLHCQLGVGGNSKANPSRAEPASRSAKKWMFTKKQDAQAAFFALSTGSQREQRSYSLPC